jgi:hypothetical protein
MTKLYVLVDKHLRSSQQAVQAAHAAAEFCLKDKGRRWTNGTIVIAKVDNINDWVAKAEAVFREPDMANMVTAVAYLSLDLDPTLKLL